MTNPDVRSLTREIDGIKGQILRESNLKVSDKKLMHAWFKYFDQKLRGSDALPIKRDLYDAFKIMSDLGVLMRPFNVAPHDPNQKIIKGPAQLVEFSRRFDHDDFKNVMMGMMHEKEKMRNEKPKKHVKTVVTNKKVVEEDRNPTTGVPKRVTTISTTLEVDTIESSSTIVETEPIKEKHGKLMPMDPETKKQKILNIKTVENSILNKMSDQIPEAAQIFKQWISILSNKLNKESDYDNRLNALMALNKCAENHIIAPPFDELPVRGIINIREFLRRLQGANMYENIRHAIEDVKDVESHVPDDVLESGGVGIKIEGRIPRIINQRMQIIPLKQQIYETQKRIAYAFDNIDESLAENYKKWSLLFERGLSAGFKELYETLEFEKECEEFMKKGILPDILYEDPPSFKGFNLAKAREIVRKLKEFNGSDLTNFPEIVDYHSMTQEERKQMFLKKRAEKKRKKNAAKIQHDISEHEDMQTPKKQIASNLADPMVKNDVIQSVTKTMTTVLNAVAHENVEILDKIPTITDQVQDAVMKSAQKRLGRMRTYDEIVAYHRQFKPKSSPIKTHQDFVPFTLEEIPLETEDVSRVVQGDLGPLLDKIGDDDDDLFNISKPKLVEDSSSSTSIAYDYDFIGATAQPEYNASTSSISEDERDQTVIHKPILGKKHLTFTATKEPHHTHLLEIEYPSVGEFSPEYDPIPNDIKEYIVRMVKKSLTHWPVWLQEYGSQLKWPQAHRNSKTGELMRFSP